MMCLLGKLKIKLSISEIFFYIYKCMYRNFNINCTCMRQIMQMHYPIADSLCGFLNSTPPFLVLFRLEKLAKSQYWIRSIQKNKPIAAITANKVMRFFSRSVQPNCPMKSLMRKLLSPLPY